MSTPPSRRSSWRRDSAHPRRLGEAKWPEVSGLFVSIKQKRHPGRGNSGAKAVSTATGFSAADKWGNKLLDSRRLPLDNLQ